MGEITGLFSSKETTCLGAAAAGQAMSLAEAAGLIAYPGSLATAPGAVALLAKTGLDKSMLIAAPEGSFPGWSFEFSGRTMTARVDGVRISMKICPLAHDNAQALRRNFPYTRPVCMGLATAIGTGDRLGLATPGHIRAVRGAGLAAFLAQQSIREMTRTARLVRQVLDDVSWGVFEEGFDEGFGSDADHLKTTADVDACAAVGFTMFTVDPGDYVDGSADSASIDELMAKFEGIDFGALETTAADLRRDYLRDPVTLPGDVVIEADEEALLRAVVKYGAAVSHTAAMFRHLATERGEKPFELEMSVDETETPTTTFEHYFVARELRRMGVKWVSMAPRFIGEFEKGIDYKGDLEAFRKSFAEHVAVMREYGPYKISIHSGSDKFSIYPIMAELADGLVHLKTAGTSYLEALRVIAHVAPELFREILAFAFDRYDTDKASYHVSADPSKVPRPDELVDDALASVLDIDDGRQLLHVTFGSVLTTKRDEGYLFRERLLMALRWHEEEHYDALEKHLKRHIEPFGG